MAEVKNIGTPTTVTTIENTEQASESGTASVQQPVEENTKGTIDALKKQSAESRSLTDLQGKIQGRALEDQLNKKQQSLNPAQMQFYTGSSQPITNAQGQPITAAQAAIDRLADAATKGDIVKLRQLIAAGVDVNGKDSITGDTPLSNAAARGHKEIVDELMKNGARIDERGTNGQTALIRASTVSGNENMVHRLIHDYNADVNAQDKAGRSALMMTAINNDPKSMKELLDADAWTNILDGHPGIDPEPGQNALMFAAARGNKECMELLLKAGVDVDMLSRKGQTAISLAAQKGQTEAVEMLLKANANPNVPDREKRTPVMIAAANGYDKVVKALAAQSAALDEQDTGGSTAVYEAVTNHQHKALKELLDAHTNPDIPLTLPAFTKNWTALMNAASDGDLKSVELLVQARAKRDIINSDGNTALMVAQQALTNPDLSADERKNYAAIIQLLQGAPKSP